MRKPSANPGLIAVLVALIASACMCSGATINAVFPPMRSTDANYSDFSYVLASPLVDGINPHLDWSLVDKGPGAPGGQYQWGAFDNEIERFIDAGKKVNIIVWPISQPLGEDADPNNSATPAYVLSDPNIHKFGCSPWVTGHYPLPSDPNFVSAYQAFIAQVIQHYRTNPNIGYIRFGLSAGGEVYPWCAEQAAALVNLTVGQWRDQIWLPYYRSMLAYEHLQNPPMTLMAPVTVGLPATDLTWPVQEAASAVSLGLGFGSQALQKSDITNYPTCTDDWCHLFNRYAWLIPLELQTGGETDASGTTTSVGSLPELLSFAFAQQTTIFELYKEDLLLAFDPNYCNVLKQCNSQYGQAYANAIAQARTPLPAVVIMTPTAGQRVKGTVTVSASASDSVGVAGVQFHLDKANLGAQVTSAPYSISWDTTTATSGRHVLRATAVDAAGNKSTSAPVDVQVVVPGFLSAAPTNR